MSASPGPAPTLDDEPRRVRQTLRHLSYLDAVDSKEVFNFFGNRVVEHSASSSVVLAVKHKPVKGMDRSEARHDALCRDTRRLGPKSTMRLRRGYEEVPRPSAGQ